MVPGEAHGLALFFVEGLVEDFDQGLGHRGLLDRLRSGEARAGRSQDSQGRGGSRTEKVAGQVRMLSNLDVFIYSD